MAVFSQAFIENTRAVFGGAAQAVLDALAQGDAVTAVRANPAKISANDLRCRFEAAGEDIPWCRDAFWLDSRPVFSLDPLLHAGAYYVQDPSAMFVGSLADRLIEEGKRPLKILDLCAAPGGKSTAIAAALRPDDLLIAANTEGVDLIIGGHSHTFIKEPAIVESKSGKKVVVVQAGEKGEEVGRIDINF